MDEKKSDIEATLATEVGRTISRPALTRNGEKLHPQPTSDPLDPLLWTSFRKHSILAIVMAL